MTEELKVTVIVTGLGQNDSNKGKMKSTHITKKDGTPDYRGLERPTVIRKQATTEVKRDENGVPDVDYLDIPAFLRRQEEVS